MSSFLSSEGRYFIPAVIRGHKITIELDVVDSNIPLLFARGEMRNLGVILDLAEDKIEILGERGPIMTTGDGHPTINLL